MNVDRFENSWCANVLGSACLAGALFAVHVPAGADVPKVPQAEMRAIYKAADLTQKKGKAEWVNSCGEPAPDKSEVADLNGKGKPGVFLYVTGSCLHWEGSRFKLYIKSKDGQWKDALGVAAKGYKFLPVRHNGYFDLEIHNVGVLDNATGAVYCWNGDRYIFESLKRCGR